MTVLWMSVKEGRVAEGEPGAFLFRVAKCKWLDHVRSAAHKHMRVVHDERLIDRRDEVVDDIDERIVRLRGVYEQLDDKCRSVLDRFYFERKDLATIAAEMGVEEESIRTIKYRCMMKLRAYRRSIAGEEAGTP
jgi:RNA polymerase sigma factor (sigma-70 family)